MPGNGATTPRANRHCEPFPPVILSEAKDLRRRRSELRVATSSPLTPLSLRAPTCRGAAISCPSYSSPSTPHVIPSPSPVVILSEAKDLRRRRISVLLKPVLSAVEEPALSLPKGSEGLGLPACLRWSFSASRPHSYGRRGSYEL
jgi:hypothetical protein